MAPRDRSLDAFPKDAPAWAGFLWAEVSNLADSQNETTAELKAIHGKLTDIDCRVSTLEKCPEPPTGGGRPAVLIRIERPVIMRALWVAGVGILLLAVGLKVVPASVLLKLIPGIG